MNISAIPGKVSSGSGSYNLDFVLPGSNSADRTILAFSTSAVSAPLALTHHTPTFLDDRRRGADVVIISHPDFVSALAPLVKGRSGLAEAVRRPLRPRRRDPVRLFLPDAAIRQQHRIGKQVQRLCKEIAALPSAPMVFIDQEGGLVRRLKEGRGFGPLPSAKEFNHLAPDQKRAILAAALPRCGGSASTMISRLSSMSITTPKIRTLARSSAPTPPISLKSRPMRCWRARPRRSASGCA